MKKLNLSSISQILSDKEMKNVTGGVMMMADTGGGGGSSSGDVCDGKEIACNNRMWSCAEVKAGMCYNSYCKGFCSSRTT